MVFSFLMMAAVVPNAQACDRATSTAAIVSCLTEQTSVADGRLNVAYRDARARVPAMQARGLQAAQRAWIRFRDAQCRADAMGEGTIARIAGAGCLLNMTTARARELDRFAQVD